MKLKRIGGGGEIEVEIVSREGTSLRLRIDGEEISGRLEPIADGSAMLTLGARRLRVFGARTRKSFIAAAGPSAFVIAEAEDRRGRSHSGLMTPEITAPMPGKVTKVLVAEGDRVSAGDGLVVIEAMKMETTLRAESDAVVKKILAAPGATVDHGAVLIELGPAPA